ncbi:hypothetical protein E3N88_29764 [Mikania micrantha]|uniref:Uncharacterized protein n=1 Tax=Mikania micrantha TaxID=192012 RepID=A0A5N6MJQ8_9ASTR|nr:hypothetical protein E3N88_29764 [Mikania micrantha]
MKLGLLGSSGTHRGTRWPTENPIAIRNRWAGDLNPEFLRGTRSIFLPLSAPPIYISRFPNTQHSSSTSENTISSHRKPFLKLKVGGESLESTKKLEHHHLSLLSVEPSTSRGLRSCSFIIPRSFEALEAGDRLHYLTLQELTLTLVHFTKVTDMHMEQECT